MSRLRRAGSKWRVLVHDMVPGGYGRAHHIASVRIRTDPKYADLTHLPGTELDEVVVGQWMHLEQMDSGVWWYNVGGVTLWIRADRDGRPKRVTVYGPDDYDFAVDGCEYELAWTRVQP